MDKYLYFNIITHKVKSYSDLTEEQKKAFEAKLFDKKSYLTPEEQFDEVASMIAEFSQVINMSFGYEYIDEETGEIQWREHSVNGTNEIDLLRKISAILDAFDTNDYKFAGYNVTWFDIPYLTKRFIINEIRIPESLKRYDKKYWEIDDFNLKQFWKLNSYQDTPLEIICTSLGISIEDELDIYEIFSQSVDEIDFDKLTRLSELRNKLVHAVHEKINNLI